MSTAKLKLKILEGEFSIYRFSSSTKIPDITYESSFYTISKTDDELSIVCESKIKLQADESEHNWRCFKVLGPLDFSLTGIISKISSTFAESKISIFAISTYDTDYILVKSQQVELAKESLIKSGYPIENL